VTAGGRHMLGSFSALVKRSNWFLGALILVASLSGCRQRPRAPLLQDDPVYHNATEHVRFLAPEGWTQHARSEFPPGPIPEEHLLVDYLHWTGDMPAILELSVVDLPESTDLLTYLTTKRAKSFGAQQWQVVSSGEQVEAGGASGQRFVMESNEHAARTKEVTVFRRGRRVFFFIGVFLTGDMTARDQIRRAIKSIVWD
jgi:hypothetical protein